MTLKVDKMAISTKCRAAGLAAVLGLAFMGNVASADMVAQNCAASAEALGIFKSMVFVACMDERDASRRDVLDNLDRSISQVRASLDKACY